MTLTRTCAWQSQRQLGTRADGTAHRDVADQGMVPERRTHALAANDLPQRRAQGPVQQPDRPHPAAVDYRPGVGPRRAGRLHEYVIARVVALKAGGRRRLTVGRAAACLGKGARLRRLAVQHVPPSGHHPQQVCVPGLCQGRCASDVLGRLLHGALAQRQGAGPADGAAHERAHGHLSDCGQWPQRRGLPLLQLGVQIFRNNVICPNETSPIYGIDVSSSPSVGGSIMVGFDFDVSCGPVVNLPPEKDTGASACARRAGRRLGTSPR